jgi:Ni/Co efflux regulator RcnB
MKTLLLTAAAALALAAAPAASADPGGKGHKPHGAKAHPHGMPPGQAKKMWRRGEHLPANYLAANYYVTDYARYRLPPPPPRYRYVYVEERVYLVDPTTRLIRDVLDVLIR